MFISNSFINYLLNNKYTFSIIIYILKIVFSFNLTDSSASEETEQPRQTRRSAKRAAEIEHEEEVKHTIKGCKHLLAELLVEIKKSRDSWPFMAPVTKDEVPDYYDYISQPMDFGTIKTKFENNEYRTLQAFYSDCLLVFDNCQTYNTEHSEVYK